MRTISENSKKDIRSKFFSNITYPQKLPTIYSMAGIPGAGKTFFIKQAQDKGHFPTDAFLLSPDNIMALLPEYQEALSKETMEEAFNKWEMPARAFSYELLDEAISLRSHIIKDMGCTRLENYEILKSLKQKGYKIILHYIYCNLDDAIRRCQNRTRHTPHSMIIQRSKDLNTLLPDLVNLADDFLSYNNTDLSQPLIPTAWPFSN